MLTASHTELKDLKCFHIHNTYPNAGDLDRQLSGTAWPFGQICREFYKTNLPWNYRLSDQVQYSVVASRTSNQAWKKDLDADTYCE